MKPQLLEAYEAIKEKFDELIKKYNEEGEKMLLHDNCRLVGEISGLSEALSIVSSIMCSEGKSNG